MVQKYGNFTEGVDLADWWSFSAGGSALQPAQQPCPYSISLQGEVLSQEQGAPLALSSLSCVKEEREERDVGEEGKKRMETVKEEDGESEESEDMEERDGREVEEKTAYIQDIFFSHYPNIR